MFFVYEGNHHRPEDVQLPPLIPMTQKINDADRVNPELPRAEASDKPDTAADWITTEIRLFGVTILVIIVSGVAFLITNQRVIGITSRSLLYTLRQGLSYLAITVIDSVY